MSDPAQFVGEIVAVTGPSGAGKSTVAERLVDRFEPAVLVVGDSLFWSIRRGYIEPWKPESHAQNTVVAEALGAAAGRFAAGGYMVVLDWYLGPWFLDTFRSAAAAPMHYAVLRPSAEVTMARATARGEPWLTLPEPVAQLHTAFSHLGDLERNVIDTTSLDVDATVDVLHTRLEAGTLRLP